MKKFCVKMVLFLLLLGVSVTGLLVLSAREPFRSVVATITKSTQYGQGYNEGPSEIIPYINKVQQQDGYTKLILGDSVSFRLFSELQEDNPEYCIASSNRAITMSGQYILASEFLESHPEATDIYLTVIEDSLATTYETGYGYQYAVIPFVLTDTIDNLDEETMDEMGHVYGHFFMKKKVVQLVSDSPLNRKLYLNILNKVAPSTSGLTFPNVTNVYIVKLHSLCEEKGVTLHLIPLPVMDTQERHDMETVLRKEYEKTPMAEIYPDYFDQFIYYPPEKFSDNVHVAGTREELNDMIREIQQKTNTMEDLVLEEGDENAF